MSEDQSLASLISAAVAAKMTPEFIEKEVNTRVEKLIVDSVNNALRSYSDTGKLIEKAVQDALRVDQLDLPSYGSVVTAILKSKIEARVSDLVSGRLAQDMDELLGLAPKEVKLSQIADAMRDRYEGEAHGPVITVIVEHNEYGSTWIYLDEEEHRERRDKYQCRSRILVSGDGTVSAAYAGEAPFHQKGWIGRAHGLEQKLRAYVACGTKIIIDEDAVITSVGDY